MDGMLSTWMEIYDSASSYMLVVGTAVLAVSLVLAPTVLCIPTCLEAVRSKDRRADPRPELLALPASLMVCLCLVLERGQFNFWPRLRQHTVNKCSGIAKLLLNLGSPAQM